MIERLQATYEILRQLPVKYAHGLFLNRVIQDMEDAVDREDSHLTTVLQVDHAEEGDPDPMQSLTIVTLDPELQEAFLLLLEKRRGPARDAA